MTGPVTEDSIWVAHMDDDMFAVGSFAPRARRQDLKELRDTLVKWAEPTQTWITAPSTALL